MRIPLAGLMFVLVVGCASQSQKAPPPAAPAVAATAAPATAPATAAPKTVQQAQAAGYKIVNENGKTLYCRDQMKTGSHVRQETICLTKEELEAAREASRRNMDQLMKPIPPPQGK
jgi:endonuclease I